MEKIKSALAGDGFARDLASKYEAIYSASDVWLYKKSHGVHSVILSAIKDDLPGKRYLDLGCGAGRLAIMASFFTDHATGVDFSPSAIELACLCRSVARRSNTEFAVDTIEGYCQKYPGLFDVITMVGVLEHVEDPLSTLKQVAARLKEGGTLVVSCPNFVNFRGATYMTLLTLFGLPMSLADLRQVDLLNIKEWAGQSGLTLKRTIGAIYGFAFTEKACSDMVKRVPLAVKDKKGYEAISPNYEAYNSWLKRSVWFNEKYVQWLFEKGILKRIRRQVRIDMDLSVVNDKHELLDRVTSYLKENIDSDPYYCDVPPFSHFGGEGIYFFKKNV